MRAVLLVLSAFVVADARIVNDAVLEREESVPPREARKVEDPSIRAAADVRLCNTGNRTLPRVGCNARIRVVL